jgi:hypothetical protein
MSGIVTGSLSCYRFIAEACRSRRTTQEQCQNCLFARLLYFNNVVYAATAADSMQPRSWLPVFERSSRTWTDGWLMRGDVEESMAEAWKPLLLRVAGTSIELLVRCRASARNRDAKRYRRNRNSD